MPVHPAVVVEIAGRHEVGRQRQREHSRRRQEWRIVLRGLRLALLRRGAVG